MRRAYAAGRQVLPAGKLVSLWVQPGLRKTSTLLSCPMPQLTAQVIWIVCWLSCRSARSSMLPGHPRCLLTASLKWRRMACWAPMGYLAVTSEQQNNAWRWAVHCWCLLTSMGPCCRPCGDRAYCTRITCWGMLLHSDLLHLSSAACWLVVKHANQRPIAVPQTWLVLEFCNRGCVGDGVTKGWFRKQGSRFEPDLKAILPTAREIAGALSYLHSKNILHGDLTGSNVLLTVTAEGSRGWMAKVGD
eukprot:GHUV01034037.1.p1 GENE.GHUV01034037.1~~GHUV01034037.1.p1  ORF type:complete len:246 (-),score=43.52 GHUV01034037.1:207-944(-)